MIGSLLTGDVRLEVTESGGVSSRPVTVRAFWRGSEVGVLDVSRGEAVDHRLQDYWVISYIEVAYEFRRRGVSHKMRAAVLRRACDAGVKLASDVVRSGFEEAYWEALHMRGEVDVLDLRSGRLGAIDDNDDDEMEPSEDELMGEQQNYDYVYVMRCP